jgi:cellulose synthase operon protein C
MFGRRIIIGAGLFLAGASVAIACGPYFPWQLLDDRTVTLQATPHNSFAYEASHLVTPTDHLKAMELGRAPVDNLNFASELTDAEKVGLTADQTAQIDAMRGAGDAAYEKGAGLPGAVRLYTAGAVAFHATDLASAAHRFAAVLALPPKDQRLRATWAAYMAGRVAAIPNDRMKTEAMFQLTRSLAAQGAPDPLGLAVASFGEEARFHYDGANALLVAPAESAPVTGQAIPDNPTFKGYSLPDGQAASYRDGMTRAAQLYAEQAARGSDAGVQSLRMVAEDILADPDRIDAAMPSPILERVVVIYALAWLTDGTGDYGSINDAGTRVSGVAPNPALAPLVVAIEKFAGPNPAGADRLAALCYRVGRYDLAARMADKASGPLAEWVKAKLALQKGDLAAAARHYAAATKGFPTDLDGDNVHRIAGEAGTLALARGDYIDALDKLYPLSRIYWGDVAYIAERVLTTDELKAFVDTHTATSPRKWATDDDGYTVVTNPAQQMRDLLARRLMRDGRYAAASSYFGDPGLRAKARAYATALHEGETDWDPVARAEGYFTAAKLARESGMDILGTEGPPDIGALSGDFDVGVGQSKPGAHYASAGEITRANASVPKPDLRFHYRYIAVDDATKAADLLPQRSQAFAATLCNAAGWMMETSGEEASAKAIYRRYAAHGPRVPWATHFGRDCPAPNFAGASALQRRQVFRQARHFVSAHRWPVAGFSIALVAVAFAAFFLRRRKPQGK